MKRRALGRGLAALIPSAPAPRAGGDGPGLRGQLTCAIEEVRPSTDNPRHGFDDARLDELASSIREQGIIQPLVVRGAGDGGFVLIAGERRWRAAQRAGLREVPIVVKDVAPAQAFELALVENLQREDLSPIEEAEGYRRLIDDLGYTQEAVAQRVGKDRSTVANAMRLLRLPPAVRGLVSAGRLQMGHARALLGIDEPAALERAARRVAERGLSVRQTEELVRRSRTPPADPGARPGAAGAAPAPASARRTTAGTATLRDLEARLARGLGARVRVAARPDGAGRIEIDYHSLDELDRLLEQLLGGAR